MDLYGGYSNEMHNLNNSVRSFFHKNIMFREMSSQVIFASVNTKVVLQPILYYVQYIYKLSVIFFLFISIVCLIILYTCDKTTISYILDLHLTNT